MRIALLSDFKNDTLRNVQIITRKLHKGLLRNGHDVMTLSYRNLMMQLSPLPGKTLSRTFGKKKTDQLCQAILSDYQPDLVMVLSFRHFDAETIMLLREKLPKAIFAGWYEDSLDGLDESVKAMCRQFDWLFATGGGELFKNIVNDCGLRGAFMPNPCDPDIERRHNVPEAYHSDLLFIGKLSHKYRGTDASRADLAKILVDRFGMKIIGSAGHDKVLGMDYYRHICGAKINLSVNATNDIRMYHSDRLINCMGCGAFVIAKEVPDANLLFEDNEHIRYFLENDECIELVDYYLTHEAERQKIADKGLEYTHRMFNCERIAKDIIDVIHTGDYDEPWKEIV